MRWVWDMKEGEQAPEFESEKQAQRIIELLMRHANDIALTLSRAPESEMIRDPQQPIRIAALPGRSNPCACGSGRKFKHCHGAPESVH
jgi:preprotein translocase subunit SecA